VPIGHSEFRHRIQNRTGNADLRFLCGHGAASKGTAELIFDARDGGLDETSPSVSGFFLPTASTDTGDLLDVRVALGAVDA